MGYCLFVEWSTDLICSPSRFVWCKHFTPSATGSVALTMTERVYKIAMLGNEGVGKTGKKSFFSKFLFV